MTTGIERPVPAVAATAAWRAEAAAMLRLAVPLVGVLSSTVMLGEAIGWRELSALVLITAALATVLPLPRPFRR